MTFEKAADFLIAAAKKYRLDDQAMASWVCESVRKIFVQKYPEHASGWNPSRFESGVLVIQVKNSSAASELFLRTNELLEVFAASDLPRKIEEIRIQRN